jgi:hypothetical protein
MIRSAAVPLLAVAIAAIQTPSAHPCSVTGVLSNVEMVKTADAIVRATAVDYAVRPADPKVWTTGPPDSRVRFKVTETIQGSVGPELILPGYLVDSDDFNDRQPPYTFVRPNGRSGSCFANSYRSGGQFLLFLKKTKSGELTVNWSALGPVNEQLHSDGDKWLLWVRELLRSQRDPSSDHK